MAKTSLEKSHSKWSNFKLTMLCTLASLFSFAFWLVLAMRDKIAKDYVFYILIAACALLVILFMSLFSKFKR